MESLTKRSVDLLSAALNESGLINCEAANSKDVQDLLPVVNVNNEKDTSKSTDQPLISSINKQQAKGDETTARSSSTGYKLPHSSIISSGALPDATSKIAISSLPGTSTTPGAVTVIPTAKIIKLPALKTGSVIKIKTLPQPEELLIKKHINMQNHHITTSILKIPNSTQNLNAISVSHKGPKNSKVIAGGKAIFIPISKPQIPKLEKVVQPSGFVNGNVHKVSTQIAASATKRKVATATISSKGILNSSGLNLGSMFIENAEKAVDSDFETPPGSPFRIVLNENESEKINNKISVSSHSSTDLLNGAKFLCVKPNFPSSRSIPTIQLSMKRESSFHGEEKDLVKDASFLRSASVPAVINKIGENIRITKHGGEELVAEDEKEEEMQHAQTYAEYMPSKLKIGLPHPDSVVETSSLASIIPPHVYYHLSIPKQTIDLGLLSALQLESIVYACQKHETFLPSGERAGFLIGDGAGVGKGRSVAGVIYENYLAGRKRALWFSVSNDLKFDAERDLRDIGAKHIKVYSLNKFKYGKITCKSNGAVKKGVIFATYSSLIGESHSQTKYHTRLKQILHWCGEDFDGPIIFDECHKAKNLVPSGAGKSTKTGITVLELQNQLPKARVIYASATGASEPRNMAYMSRLGLWGSGTPFADFMEFIQAVERRGVGAMELVAMDMKLRGSYIARQLSFYGVSFKIEEVSLNQSFINMYNRSVKLWVIAREAFQAAASMMEAEYHMKKSMWAQFWSAHQRFFKYLCLSAKVKHTVALVREAVKHGKCVVIGVQSTGEAGTVDQLEKCGGELDEFVSTAKTVFENLVTKHFPAPDRRRVAALFGKDFYKKPEVDRKRKLESIDAGSQSPSSKRSRRDSSSSSDDGKSSSSGSINDGGGLSDEEYSDFSAFSEEEDIGKIFGDDSESDERESPVKNRDLTSDQDQDSGLQLEDMKNEEEEASLLSSLDLVSGTLTSSLPGMGPVERAQALKQDLLHRLQVLGPSLPNNMLDQLIDELGGTENVAEMTGRKGRIITTDDGNVQYQSRAEEDVPVELLNMKEKQRFMDGEKNIAIISEAASSGISLQADKRVRNQRKRVHVTVELPWSADRAVQQFGRTHRSNQVNAPEYVFLITELAGEQRFASVVAKRLESLGALTHGDRRATESRDLSKFNYDNKYGRKALESVMRSIAGCDAPLVPPPATYRGSFFKDIRQGLLGVGMLTRESGQRNYQLDKDYNNIFKFMNRILGMEVEQQNAIFAFFTDTLCAIIGEAKKMGEYDQGIMDVGIGNNSVEKVKCREFILPSSGSVSLHTVRVERGTSWEEAQRLYNENKDEEENGFYITMQKRNGRHMVVLAIASTSRRYRNLFLIHRPNTGRQTRREDLDELKKKYQRVEAEEAEKWWSEHHHASLLQCSHQYWQGSCARGGRSLCHVGMRRRMYHVLSGSVLQVWRTVEYVLAREGGVKYKMQVVRLKTSDGGKLVGLLIPSICLSKLADALSDSTQNDLQQPVAMMNDDVEEESDDYEEVDEINPDDVLSSVLFSKKDSWLS